MCKSDTSNQCHLWGALGLLTDVCFLLQLLIRQWDKRLSRDILAHWLDLLSEDGWIAREQVNLILVVACTGTSVQRSQSVAVKQLYLEHALICGPSNAVLEIQILGEEARSRVPADFLAQSTDVANPPTLFLPLADMAQRVAKAGKQRSGDEQEELAFLKAGAVCCEAFFSLPAEVSACPGQLSCISWKLRPAMQYAMQQHGEILGAVRIWGCGCSVSSASGVV